MGACALLLKNLQGSYFNRATVGQFSNLARPFERHIQIVDIDHVVPAELLLGLGEWTVRGYDAAILEAHGGRSASRLERAATCAIHRAAMFFVELELAAHKFIHLIRLDALLRLFSPVNC